MTNSAGVKLIVAPLTKLLRLDRIYFDNYVRALIVAPYNCVSIRDWMEIALLRACGTIGIVVTALK